jgi:hypothetical protein
LGINNFKAIWFFQEVENQRRYIDYYEASGEGLAHYAKVLSENPVYTANICNLTALWYESSVEAGRD